MPLTESTKAKERGVVKDLKTSVPSVPLCETFYTSHPVLDLTEITKDTERGAGKDLKNLCALCASVRNSYIVPQSLVVENIHISLDKKTIYKYLFMPCPARLNPFVSISAQQD